jgi:hypothetical protein
MSDKNNGGPAFPLKEANTSDSLGISMRDYFAAHAPAMPSTFMLKHWQELQIVEIGGGRKQEQWITVYESTARHQARWALEYADAMIAERAK